MDRFTARLGLLLLLPALAGAADGVPPDAYSLEKGRDVAVCEAYLKLLRSEPRSLPMCGRPEPADGGGFTSLKRVQYSADDLYRISEPLFAFAENGDAALNEKYRERILATCKTPGQESICQYHLERKQQMAAAGEKWGESYPRSYMNRVNAWRYEPRIDIDNDGNADAVILLLPRTCRYEPHALLFAVTPTYAFIMNASYSKLDEAQTRAVFGHPVPTWPLEPQPGDFRYVGASLGVFKFEGRIYFDTFFSNFSDFDNTRWHDKNLRTTLGVFLRENGKTSQVCEYRWRGSITPAP